MAKFTRVRQSKFLNIVKIYK